MLRRVKDPRKEGVKLRPINNRFRTKDGTVWEGFLGDDDCEYEKATYQQQTIRWFVVD